MTEQNEAKHLNKDEATISSMFNGIAGKYDLLNHLMSFGMDIRWRKRMVNTIIKEKGNSAKVLDLACGTGDLTFALSRKGFNVVGGDISQGMLDVAIAKKETEKGLKGHIEFRNCSAESIPYPDGTFDAATISFGIRNFDHREKCLAEIRRVLKKDGKLYIMEFAEPRNRIWRFIFGMYFKYYTPAIGRMISKDTSAYSYLPESVRQFPKYQAFIQEMEQEFENCSYRSLSGGIALLYKGNVRK